MSTITIGVDLAKSVFSVCKMDAAGHVLRRFDLKRDAVAAWLAQLPAGTVVAMEACSGAHYWARRCLAYGLEPRIIAAQFVKPFRKSSRTKNDWARQLRARCGDARPAQCVVGAAQPRPGSPLRSRSRLQRSYRNPPSRQRWRE